MSEPSTSNKTSNKPLSTPQYTWEYEYYEYAQVSFEGLKAHKSCLTGSAGPRYELHIEERQGDGLKRGMWDNRGCPKPLCYLERRMNCCPRRPKKTTHDSIVIGFWVGLAVFVIFMFFVLTLLTKTGAPHQENVDATEKRFQVDRFTANFRRSLDTNRVLSCQVEETRSLFHCYINEVDQQDRTKSSKDIGDSGLLIQQTVRNCGVEVEMDSHPKFNIPNYVSTEQNSSIGDEDLLIYDPTVILENLTVNSSQSNFPN
uniref:Melanocortin 2 receptor accessory protein 2 n=1 Tax=Leptobrachium leishanense TaxID=445787 RepID=A0A8C5QGK3_9ANUR